MMKNSYSGNRKPFILSLFAEEDRAQVTPYLEELDGRGLNLCYDDARFSDAAGAKASAVIAFISGAALGDGSFSEALGKLFSGQLKHVVMVYLERVELPETIKRISSASNALFAENYPTPAALAERLLTSPEIASPHLTAAQNKGRKRLTAVAAVAAVIVLGLAVLFVMRTVNGRQSTGPAVFDGNVPPDIGGLLASGLTLEDLQNVETFTMMGDRVLSANETATNFNLYSFLDRFMREDSSEHKYYYMGEEIPKNTQTDFSLLSYMSSLGELTLVNQADVDLSPLAGNEAVKRLSLMDCNIQDLSFLRDLPNLESLDLYFCDATDYGPLEDCSSLIQLNIRTFENQVITMPERLPASLKSLTFFFSPGIETLDFVSDCAELEHFSYSLAPDLRDISALGNCALQHLFISSGGMSRLPNLDVAFLQDIPTLQDVSLYGYHLDNLDFLAGHSDGMSLGFEPENVGDLSGLSYISHYDRLAISGQSGMDRALSMVEEVDTLDLQAMPLTRSPSMPKHIQTLSLGYCRGQNLSVFEGVKIDTLELLECSQLQSLDGVENSGLTKFSARNCTSLRDYSALESAKLDRLSLQEMLFLPELSNLTFNAGAELWLTDCPLAKDISFLDVCPTAAQIATLHFDFLQATDLSPLKRMPLLSALGVPPQLEEMAKQMALVPEDHLMIMMPSGEWSLENIDLPITQLSDLEDYSEEMLSYVSSLALAGDTVFDLQNQLWFYGDKPGEIMIMDFSGIYPEDGQPVGPGVIQSMDQLSGLTSLKTLTLVGQPLTDLNGIQAMVKLRSLELRACDGIRDYSPLFALPELETVNLSGEQISSLEGIQNLSKLCSLDISNTLVSDLSPLAGCDFRYSKETLGFSLGITGTEIKDCSALAAVPSFRELNVSGIDRAGWMPYIKNAEQLVTLNASYCNLNDEDAAAIAAIPGLTSCVVAGNKDVTDLTPFLGCEDLQILYVSGDMTKAIASLDGQNLSFDFIVW